MLINQISFKQDRFTPADISQVVALHRREIGQGFLSSLGDKTLALIFSVAADSQCGVLVTAQDRSTGRVYGFVCGATRTGAFYQEFLRRHFLSGLIALAARLFSPSTAGKAMETLLYPTKRTRVDLPAAELLIIAVDDDYKGDGLAQALFYELVKAFNDKGITTFKVVAGANLCRAQRFYQKLGPVQSAPIEVHRGQPSIVYIYTIGNYSAPLTPRPPLSGGEGDGGE
ncbi:MAG: GNAT family N-acetyltransferase [Chloroflexota bacterium]